MPTWFLLILIIFQHIYRQIQPSSRNMPLKWWFKLPRDPEQEPHHRIQFNLISKVPKTEGGLIPQQTMQSAYSTLNSNLSQLDYEMYLSHKELIFWNCISAWFQNILWLCIIYCLACRKPIWGPSNQSNKQNSLICCLKTVYYFTLFDVYYFGKIWI